MSVRFGPFSNLTHLYVRWIGSWIGLDPIQIQPILRYKWVGLGLAPYPIQTQPITHYKWVPLGLGLQPHPSTRYKRRDGLKLGKKEKRGKKLVIGARFSTFAIRSNHHRYALYSIRYGSDLISHHLGKISPFLSFFLFSSCYWFRNWVLVHLFPFFLVISPLDSKGNNIYGSISSETNICRPNYLGLASIITNYLSGHSICY